MKRLDSVSVFLFKNLINVNLFVSIGVLLICILTGRPGSIVFGSILFLSTLTVFMFANWHDTWYLEAGKKISYVGLGAMVLLALFANSTAFTFGVVIDIIVADMLFSRYVTTYRTKQNKVPMYIISAILVVVFLDTVFNIVHPDLHLYSKSVDVVLFLFVIAKIIYTSSILYAESRRMAAQRVKEELFIDYSAEFNNFFSHYINTPLTTALSNIEIARLKINRSNPDVLDKNVLIHFKRIDEGLSNVSKTTRELANIHYIRSEVLRSGASMADIKEMTFKLVDEYDADLEQVIDNWPEVFIPVPMVQFTLSQMLKNARSYAEVTHNPRLVIHVETEYLVLSVFNKGNIPDLSSDILHPFKRGINTLEGTGTGLGLSLVNDLTGDYNCSFSLENVGGYTRCQLKLPLEERV